MQLPSTRILFRPLLTFALLLTLALASALSARPASAQAQRCFSQTGFCISGVIRSYWERNGGLGVFGYPISDLRTETVEGSLARAGPVVRARPPGGSQQGWPGCTCREARRALLGATRPTLTSGQRRAATRPRAVHKV